MIGTSSLYALGMLGTDERPHSESAAPSRSPQRHHALGRPKSPVKLTPLERKERDQQRQRDQAQRRLQTIKDRDALALALLSSQHKSSHWHRQERQDEELVLRRFERDIVDVQRCHSAAAGYQFSRVRTARDVAVFSPVFQGYSPALCPPSQVSTYSVNVPPSTVIHPGFSGFCVSKHNDASAISPVFFLVRYNKIPLDEVDIGGDDDRSRDDDDDNDDDDESLQSHDQFLARQKIREGPGAGRVASITKLSPSDELDLQEILRARFAPDAGADCFVCYGSSAVGCPGCFEFSHKMYQNVQSAHSTKRLKTPKTRGQECEERELRHTGLRLKLMGFENRSEEDHLASGDHDGYVFPEKVHRPKTMDQHAYYVNVLADGHAIRKHRSVLKNYVLLHIKTLPVGNLITLQVDVRSTISYVYELYRSSVDSPNRKIHLLLPTTSGLFYLNELIESATDTRCGLVNGDFLVEDFHLHGANEQPPTSPLAKRNPLREPSLKARIPEFMLFSVAILSETSTPKLVANFLQQNFHFDEENAAAHVSDGSLCIEYATVKLPKAPISQDVYQKQLVPHVHGMKDFARVSKQLERIELERERERLLWVAYQERKLARLEEKHNNHRLMQGDGHRKRKVARAMAYLDFVLESTSNPQRARVWEERLEKLWQCAQFFEESKLCKHGRLVDAENTADTRQLVQRHLDATVAAFDSLLGRRSGTGPLVFPVQCVGSSGTNQRLVVKIGVRQGCSAADNQDYGLVLDLNQDFEVLSNKSTFVVDGERERMESRDFTKQQLVALNQEHTQRTEAASSWRCADWEWKSKPTEVAQSSLLFTGSDLVRAPFLHFPWHVVVQAYKQVLQSVAFQLAKLDEYNALARILQQEDAQLGKTQIEKWGSDVQSFQAALLELAETGNSPLLKTSVLLRASERVLKKKGVALLKKRLRQRRQQMRERELELERLRVLQEENTKPKKSVVELLKTHFITEKAPKINAVLEPTPAEILLQKAEQLLGAVAAKASAVALAAKKEYNVRAL